MSEIILSSSYWEEPTYQVKPALFNNYYRIENPTSETGFSVVSRPSLHENTDIGSGPIRGGVRGYFKGIDSVFIVSGTSLYSRQSDNSYLAIGTITGADSVEAVIAADAVFICSNGLLFRWDGMTLSQIIHPDAIAFSSVATINSYVLLTEVGTNRWFWLEPFDVIFDVLNFASAEQYPDPLICVKVTGDEIWLLGSESTEVWQNTGDPLAPFQRLIGRTFNKGCLSKEAVSVSTYQGYPCILWITDTGEVVRGQGTVRKISTESLEKVLQTENNVSSFSITNGRHDFYVITAGTAGCFCYDQNSEDWGKWTSGSVEVLFINNGIGVSTNTFLGYSTSDNKVYTLGERGYDVRDGQNFDIKCQITGFLPTSSKAAPVHSIRVEINTGFGEDYINTPLVEMRFSDDRGASWNPWMQKSLGIAGDYSEEISFRSLGRTKSPGRVIEFRITGQGRHILNRAFANES